MDKHAANREYFAADADRKLRTEQHLKAVAQLSQLEGNVLRAIELLVKFLDKKVTKTEVINQLREVSTPDVLKVVAAVEKLDDTVQQNKIDLSGVEQELKNAVEQLKQVPKTLPDAPEAIESVKVSNLSDIDLKPLLDAINALDLKVEAPVVNVDAPKVDVAAPDLKPIKAIFTDLLKAVKNIKMPDVKLEATDTSKIEKELEKQTKQLDELIKQPKGGGGGGGNGSPYVDSTGKVVNVELEMDGSIPVTVKSGGSSSSSGKTTDAYGWQATSDDGTYKYFYFEDASANYYVMRKHKTNKVATYTKGTGGYTTVYVSSSAGPSGSPTWSTYGGTF